MDICQITRYFDHKKNAGIGMYSEKLLEKISEEHNVKSIETETEGRIGYFLYTSLGLLNHPNGFDVYHAMTPLEAIHTPKEKTVVTFHDLLPFTHKEQATWYGGNPITSNITAMWFKYACEVASSSEQIICNSRDTKREVMKHLDVDEDKIAVTRLGISSDLEPTDGGKYSRDGFTVGTLSFLDRRKRIELLIDSFKEVNDSEAELWIPSTGPDEQRLKRKAEGDNRIKFLGYLPEEEKADFLSSLNVFVLPSKLEGYGIPFVEAMMCRTPVVSLEDALIPNDVKRRTHCVESENLSKLLRDGVFDCDIDANYEFAKKHSWNNCAERTLKIYEEVID